MLAKEFVAAQLMENLFIALRVIAEKELIELNAQNLGVGLDPNESTLVPVNVDESSRHPRQDDNDEDAQSGLYPQVSNLIKAIFGQTPLKKPNITNYVDSATASGSKPVSNQVVGLVNAIMSAIPIIRPTQQRLQAQPKPPRLPQQQLPPQVLPLKPQLQIQQQFQPQPQIQPQFQPQDQPQNRVGDKPTSNIDGVGGAQSFQNNEKLLELLLANSGGGQGQPFPSQNNNVHQPNQLDPSQLAALELFLEQFHATQFSSPSVGGVSIGGGIDGSNTGTRGRVTSKPYIYNPTSAGGIASTSAAFKPPKPVFANGPETAQLQQQLQHLLNQQVGGQARPPFQGNNQGQQGPSPSSSTAIPSEEDEDEDEDDDSRRRLERQFTVPFFPFLSNIFRPTPPPVPITPGPVTQPPSSSVMVIVDGQAVVVEAQPATPVQPLAVAPVMQQQPFNFATFSQTVSKNFGDIVRIMPSLLMGARQGVQLIQTISQLFGGLDALGDIAGGIL